MGYTNAIQKPQTAMIDKNGYAFTWPGQPLEIGREIEINDKRLIVDAICEAPPTFLTFPTVFVSYSTALDITPPMRNKLSFILVKANPDQSLDSLKQKIESNTGLQALTSSEFSQRSISYYLTRTGIPINFGITVFLGILIGAAITAQTFYIFIIENIKQFAAMKAFGFTNSQLLRIVWTQAALVGSIGYSLGIGLTALFFKANANNPALAGFMLLWQVMLGTGIIITIIIVFSTIFSLRKVFKLDPAMVFKG